MSQPAGEMRIEPRLGDLEIALLFARVDVMERFFAEALRDQAFMLSLPCQPEPFTTLLFRARVQGLAGLDFKAIVVQAFRREEGAQVVFQFADWSEALAHQLKTILDPSLEQAGQHERNVVAEGGREEDHGEVQGTSPIFRIRELDTPARTLLAAKADHGERAILCRDTMAPVLLALLSNPRLDGENVLAIAKSVYVTPSILQRIATDRRWLAIADIRLALVHNPKTPTPIAQRLLETLPMNELRSLAKMGNSKEDLRRIALALVTKGMTSR